MVVNWIKRWFKTTTHPFELSKVSRDQHFISRKNISPNALKVLYRLGSSGHKAFLVGGCVRDLQLNKEPKDFDIATNATPEQIHALFRNSRIIGRRFRIVHVNFGRETIEVTTFRGLASEQDTDQQRSAEGMLLRDNVYGSLDDDAKRRDFTINAMYYTTEDFSLQAYPAGLKDLEERKLRIIGDAQTRYREDPVRMLRAIRFSAKLGFQIEPKTADPIQQLAPLLENIAPARLFDEVIKLLMQGHGVATYQLLQNYTLFEFLFPQTHLVLTQNDNHYYHHFIQNALKNTDKRIQAEHSVTPTFLYATLLWPAVRELAKQHQQSGIPESPAWQKAAAEVVSKQNQSVSIPKRFALPMKEIWELQLRLPKRNPAKVEQVIAHSRFRAAYDFLLLREQSGEKLNNLGKWWTEYQQKHPEKRALQTPYKPKKRPYRQRKPISPTQQKTSS